MRCGIPSWLNIKHWIQIFDDDSMWEVWIEQWCVLLFSFSFIMHCDLWSMMKDQKQKSHTKNKIIIHQLKSTIFYSRNFFNSTSHTFIKRSRIQIQPITNNRSHWFSLDINNIKSWKIIFFNIKKTHTKDLWSRTPLAWTNISSLGY